MRKLLSWIDRGVTKALLSKPGMIPKPWRKAIAWFYPNALVRKEYLDMLGVHMGDGTLANVCLIPVPGDGVGAWIGSNVSIAPNVTLVMSSNPNNAKELKGFRYISEGACRKGDIVIDDEAWIGANATILPGVRIGRFAVIGAGAVMTRDADDYGVYAGVPGRKIGDVRDLDGSLGDEGATPEGIGSERIPEDAASQDETREG